jgi:hypothetical protein
MEARTKVKCPIQNYLAILAKLYGQESASLHGGFSRKKMCFQVYHFSVWLYKPGVLTKDPNPGVLTKDPNVWLDEA